MKKYEICRSFQEPRPKMWVISENAAIYVDNILKLVKADDPQKVVAEKCISQNIRLPAKNLNFYSTEKFKLMAGCQIFWEMGLSAIMF